MDGKKLLEVVDAIVAEDKAKKNEAFKKRQRYWTSMRMILQKIIPMLAGKIEPSVSEDVLKKIGFDDQVADILSWVALQVCRQDQAQKITWDYVDSLREGQLTHLTFGAAPIKITPYGGKPNQVVEISAILAIHVTDRFSKENPAPNNADVWATIYLGGNEKLSFRMSDAADKAVRDMATRTLINHLKTQEAK